MPLPSEILEQIDEKYRDHASLNDFNSVDALAQSFVETKSMVGNSVRTPSKDATPQERQEYWDKLINNDPELMMKPDFQNKDQSREFFRTLGLPEEFAKYENPEGMELPSDVESEMRELLYSANLTNSQYQTIMAAFSERQAQTNTMNTELHDSGMAQLKGKWGQAMDDRITAAKQANEDFYPGRNFDTLSSGERESLFNISKAMTGKGAVVANDRGGIPSDAMTPGEATLRANELLSRAQNADPNKMTREEIASLVKQSIDLRVKYCGSVASMDEQRA
jgi:hypothetical protein